MVLLTSYARQKHWGAKKCEAKTKSSDYVPTNIRPRSQGGGIHICCVLLSSSVVKLKDQLLQSTVKSVKVIAKF